MDLKRGDRLGAYEILTSLGAGGMGEVFRARDTRLGRDVALKFLTGDVAAAGDRRTRFDREARTLAALNHPGIVSIYAVEIDGERPFIAMECVEGRVLQELIPQGGLPLDRLLNIATQIASAVAAAHRHGVVHRDLKPANVMVGAHDQVKVLDFGLAKLREGSAATAETLPTQQVITGEGRILGTVAYMSPEQAEGRVVDQRSDIFSLGVLLYEMASGQRPFKGDTSLSVLSSILRDTPKPLSEINPGLPREVARIVRRCLAKDPDDRYQSATDLRNDLEDVRQSSISGELFQSGATPRPRAWRPWTLAAVVVLALFGAAAMVAWPTGVTTVRTVPEMRFSRLTLLEGVAQEPIISPDGKWVAYVTAVSGNEDIYLQSTTGQTAINLTKDSQAPDRSPSFSPDGEFIAFRSERDGGGLFVMGRTGESVRRLTRTGFQPAWFPDGQRLVFASAQVYSADSRGGVVSELWTVDIAGGEPKRLFAGDAVQPRVSPNGHRIAFWALPVNDDFSAFLSPNRDVWTIAADGSNPVRVTVTEATDWNPVWSPDGQGLFFLSNRSGSMNLWRVEIDERTGVPSGEVQALTVPESYVRHFSLSEDGRLATYANAAATNNLARVRFNPRTASIEGTVEALTTGPRDFLTFDVHPDGRQVVLMTSPTQQEDLVILSDDGTGLRQLTNDRLRDRNPRWARDGQRIWFYSDRNQNYELFSVERDGGGLRQLTDTGGRRFFPVPSPDGSKLLAADITAFELFVHDATDFTKPAERLPSLPAAMQSGNLVTREWSPDGRFISGTSAGMTWVYSFESQTYRRVAPAGPSQWLPDGDRMLMVRGGRVFALDLKTGAERPIVIPGVSINTARVSPDGKYLYFLHGNQTGDIWLARFEGGSAGTRTIDVGR